MTTCSTWYTTFYEKSCTCFQTQARSTTHTYTTVLPCTTASGAHAALSTYAGAAQTYVADTPGADTPDADTPGAETPGAETSPASPYAANTSAAKTGASETSASETPCSTCSSSGQPSSIASASGSRPAAVVVSAVGKKRIAGEMFVALCFLGLLFLLV